MVLNSDKKILQMYGLRIRVHLHLFNFENLFISFYNKDTSSRDINKRNLIS